MTIMLQQLDFYGDLEIIDGVILWMCICTPIWLQNKIYRKMRNQVFAQKLLYMSCYFLLMIVYLGFSSFDLWFMIWMPQILE
jgi:hypothetical protein